MFTDRLLTTIREQRRNGTRVMIATQEPTLSETLLDLCSVSIVHFFKSPSWFTAIRNHLGAASTLTATDQERAALFDEIMHLPVGQSLVFAPTAMVQLDVRGKADVLGASILKMTTRLRNGVDAGMSVLT
ncbi:hypothetical protein MRB53_038347 [Persea americana]|nr:hypothetical protein MRB53_038347 [Persea americana]